MKDLNSLLIFAKIVGAGSFSEAARRLKMPISTVSRRIVELEDQLGVRLLERSTRNVRLTELGVDLLKHAQHSVEISEAVDNVISNKLPDVSGTLRFCAPPSISDSLIAPVVSAFQASYPNVRVQGLITERIVDQIAEEVDLAFKVGTFTDAALVGRKLLTYRHQVMASPSYLEVHKRPETPADLLKHRLLAFSFWKPGYFWSFVHRNSKVAETIAFQPSIAMNDYSCAYRKIRSEHIGGAVRRELGSDGRSPFARPLARPANPSPRINVSVLRCSISRTTATRGGDAVRQG